MASVINLTAMPRLPVMCRRLHSYVLSNISQSKTVLQHSVSNTPVCHTSKCLVSNKSAVTRQFSTAVNSSNACNAPHEKISNNARRPILFSQMIDWKNTSLRGYNSSSKYSSAVPPSLWKLGRLNHIAIAVPDLEKATAFYRDVLGAKVSGQQPLPEHGVVTVFVELDNTKLELLLPLGEKSPIQKFVDKNKAGGLHHVCIEVDDIKAAMAQVSASGVRCLSKEPKIGAHGKPVVFLHPADCNGVLLELEEA